jgi:hypothetical protein
MGCFEQEKEGTGSTRTKAAEPKRATPTAKSTEATSDSFENSFAEVQRNMHVGMLLLLKSLRDDLDRSIPKLLTLNANDRIKLDVKLSFHELMLAGQDSSRSERLPGGESFYREDPRREALNSMRGYFLVDPAKLSAPQRKAFLTKAQLEWKSARAKLDETLESPDVKELLSPSKTVAAPEKPPQKK